MIKEILEKDFVLKSSEKSNEWNKILADNFEHSPEVQKVLNELEVEVEDLQNAREEVEKAIEREKVRVADKEDNVAYFPRDPVMSLIQSSLHEYCLKPENEKGIVKIPKNEAENLFGDDGKDVTELKLRGDMKSFLTGDGSEELYGEFEPRDPGWLSCGVAAAIRRWRGRHKFNDKPATPFKISNKARVVLLSDWGSGLPWAQNVGKAARTELETAVGENREAHVMHLGDVYYSGWPKEYRENFLPYWPVMENEADKYTSWALNANHDMYSGGDGYFQTLLGDDRFKYQQQSSFFSLENDKWILLGLDTGYDDNLIMEEHSLYGKQDEWVYKTLSEARGKSGILTSHHQPFSEYEDNKGEKLLTKLKQPLEEKLVDAWFWGHEHLGNVYHPKENIRLPSCIGHGGIPFYTEEGDLPASIKYEYRQARPGDGSDENWNYFGFAVLDFDDDLLTVRYIDENGKPTHQETLMAKS